MFYTSSWSISNADDQSIASSFSGCNKEENRGSRVEELSSEKGCLCSGLYLHTEKAQFGASESCESPSDQRNRGDHVHPRGGPQSSGALGCSHPRGSSEGSTRRQVSYYQRNIGFGGGSGPQTGTIKVRYEATQVTPAPYV